MKKLCIAFIPWLFSAFAYKAMGQDTPPPPPAKTDKKTEEIVISRKGQKDVTLTIEMKGDKVIINGKPLIEFNDDQITINKRVFNLRDIAGMHWKSNDDFNFDFNPETFSRDMAAGFGGTFLGVTTRDDEKGARIENVTKGSPAEKAGLQKDDIIVKVESDKIENPGDLSETIREHKAKEQVKIHYLRGGKEKTTKATLEERDNMHTFSMSVPGGGFRSMSIPKTERLRELNGIRGEAPGMSFGFNRPRLGLKIQDTEDEKGVRVLEVADSSAAFTAGLRKDDIITEVGDVKVENTDDAREQLAINHDKSSYPIKARRNGSEMNFTIKIPKKLRTANL